MRRHEVLVATLTAALAAGVMVSAAPAATAEAGTSYRWVGNATGSGGDNHSWTDARNWAPQGLPGDADTVAVGPPADAASCAPAHVDGVPEGTVVTSFYLVERGSGADTCNASLTGGSLTVTGNFTWSGGDLATRVTLARHSAGMISGSEAGPMYLGAGLEAAGELTLLGLAEDRDLRIERPANLHVTSTGSLRSQGDNTVTGTSCCTAPSRIGIDGRLIVSGGTLRIQAAQLDQRGELNLDRGTLLTRAAPATASDGARYTGSGTWQLGDSGHPTRLSGTQVLGSGVRLRIGGVNAGGSETVAGSFTLAGHGTVDWAGGVIAANVTVGRDIRVLAHGTRGGNDARLLGGIDYSGARPVPVRVVNHGTVTLSGGARIATADGARLLNAPGGRLQLAAGTALTATRCCTSPDRVENRGVVSLGERVSLAGLDYVQLAGRTDVRGGSFPPVYRVFLDGGVMAGAATTRGWLVNRAAALAPGAGRVGVLRVMGNYTQVGRGALVLDIARRSRDIVRIGGRASVAGRIVTRGYVPKVGSKITVLVAARGVSRARLCVTTPSAAARTRHWSLAYRGTALQLVVGKGRAPRC